MRILKSLLAAVLAGTALGASANGEIIVVETADNALVYKVADNGRLYQSYLGPRLGGYTDYRALPLGNEAYICHGMEDYFEPALHINRPDGNSSTLLKYKSHRTDSIDGAALTEIVLADPVYGDEVTLNIAAYGPENVFKTWTEIMNNEKTPVELEKYASAMLHLDAPEYYLTQYTGEWADEAHQLTQQLHFGKKVLDTKLGSRATMQTSPFFQVSLGEPATETTGNVLTGTLGWLGNFRFTFDMDQYGRLRVISGINPYFSAYPLAKGESFVTPEFIFTLSDSGTGKASRNLHDWARRYQVKDGMGDRMTIYNNWEATQFDFDQKSLTELIAKAKDLGVDMFLLDDGWFGNKYPRHSDTQGLGDWQETADKLPDGIGALTDAAKKNDIKFGLWIEPEMVNPKSELYEKHKDWVITLPNRDEYYFRNQLVLDLANPKVQDFVFDIVDGLMTKYPDIAYFKWDCNSPITNIFSNYEGKNQTKLYVDHVRGLYKILDRVAAKYPDLPMMLCSGGGGRADYSGLKYFTEMWPSDNTNPVERLFIQWGMSQVFPAKVQAAHVTAWSADIPLKFRANVAMMGKYGFDLPLDRQTESDLAYAKSSLRTYAHIKPVVLDGDQYRLVSPYDGEHSSTMYVAKDGRRAVVFAFDINPRYAERTTNVKLQGLNPDLKYSVKEIDRYDGSTGESKIYSGRYLMTVGLPLFSRGKYSSRVYEVLARPAVVAHRGFHQAPGSVRNSIRSLVKADSIGADACEFDVWLSADSVLYVNHDPSYAGNVLETTVSAVLDTCRLANGEHMPRLEAFLDTARTLGIDLVLEMKEHKNKEHENLAVDRAIEMIAAKGLTERTTYITFSRNALDRFIARSGRPSYYLSGMDPEGMKAAKATGPDFHISEFRKHPDWIGRFHAQGMPVNVWTVNEPADINECIDMGVDFITTDNPVAAMQLR